MHGTKHSNGEDILNKIRWRAKSFLKRGGGVSRYSKIRVSVLKIFLYKSHWTRNAKYKAPMFTCSSDYNYIQIVFTFTLRPKLEPQGGRGSKFNIEILSWYINVLSVNFRACAGYHQLLWKENTLRYVS